MLLVVGEHAAFTDHLAGRCYGRVVTWNWLARWLVDRGGGEPPVLAPQLVGNLFARSGLDSEPSRLDRHPTMSRHPVTPMDEADLRLLLAKQTQLAVELVDTL